MKKILPIFYLLIGLISYGQEQLNNYKYIVVPKQFESFKQINQYQTSTLVKYLFSKEGFNVVYDDQLPDELSSNRCLGLVAELIDGSNMFTTKSTLVLKDCNSKEVFRTKEGMSKIKEYKAAYSEVIRDAFSTLSGFNHGYKAQTAQPVTISFKNDVKTLDSEKTIQVAADKPVSQVVTPSHIEPNTVSSKTQEIGEKTPKVESVLGAVFYAQAIANGYQLVDSTPKIVMYMFQTSHDNIYLGQETVGNSGLIYTKNNQWFFEYYSGDQLMVKGLNIKF